MAEETPNGPVVEKSGAESGGGLAGEKGADDVEAAVLAALADHLTGA